MPFPRCILHAVLAGSFLAGATFAAGPAGHPGSSASGPALRNAAAAVKAPAPADPGHGVNSVQDARFAAAAPALTPDPAFTGRPGGGAPRTAPIASRALGVRAPRPTRDVFGFAPYWALPDWQQWRLNLLTTIAYFGITYDAAGNPVDDAGMTGWHSRQLTDLVAAAHAQGSRVLLTVKSFNDADINSICGNPQIAVTQAVNLVRERGLDGVTVDFEGTATPSYPNIQQCFTNFMGSMYSSFHQNLPGSEVVVAGYSGAASWTGGFMNIAALAPVTDAFFVMAYDMYLPGLASPNAPLNGSSYNDTSSIRQYLAAAPASKIILGVPYYGYKWSVASPGIGVPGTMVAGHNVSTYASMFDDFACAQQLSFHWDATAATHYAQWYSPASGDPCGGNYGSWREMYYEDTASLTQKYDLVKSTGIRGVGIWALGNDSGRSELWDLLASAFTVVPWNPATVVAVTGHGNHEVWLSSASGVYTDTGGRAVGSPAAVMQDGVATVVVTGEDHRLWVHNDRSGWAPLSAVPVYCTDSPAASLHDHTFTVSCVGADRALWTATAVMPSEPALPVVSVWTPLGGASSVGPAMAMVGSSLEYWVSGMDGFVWTYTSPAGWRPTTWRVRGHLGAAAAGGTAYVAMAGADDGAVYYAVSTGAGWSIHLAGGTVVGGVGVAAYGATARIVGESANTGVWDGTVSSAGGAASWEFDGGSVDFGAGAAAEG